MTDSMVKRVEQAIMHNSSSMTDETVNAAARAAIAAMREPTEAMLKAAMETPGMQAADAAVVMAFIHGHRLPENQPSPLLQAWQAMNDAALEEKG